MRQVFNTNSEMKDIDLNEIVAESVRQMRDDFEMRSIAVEVSSETSLPGVTGHKGQLVQVLLNVLRNAMDALGGGAAIRDRRVRIEIARHGRDRVVIKVSDTGPGVEPQIAGEILELFKTTKPSGMGLGLKLCRLIVEQHGGEIVAPCEVPSLPLLLLKPPFGVPTPWAYKHWRDSREGGAGGCREA